MKTIYQSAQLTGMASDAMADFVRGETNASLRASARVKLNTMHATLNVTHPNQMVAFWQQAFIKYLRDNDYPAYHAALCELIDGFIVKVMKNE